MVNEDDGSHTETLCKYFTKIQAELKKMSTGEDITYEQFIARLGMTDEKYITAIMSSLKETTTFYKRRT